MIVKKVAFLQTYVEQIFENDCFHYYPHLLLESFECVYNIFRRTCLIIIIIIRSELHQLVARKFLFFLHNLYSNFFRT